MAQESVKNIKKVISVWLLRLSVSLSFGCYVLGCRFISSSQFSKPFKHVLNSSQEFRHPTCFNPTCHLCSFTHTCPRFRRALQHTFNCWGLQSFLFIIPSNYYWSFSFLHFYLTLNNNLGFYLFLALFKILLAHMQHIYVCFH